MARLESPKLTGPVEVGAVLHELWKRYLKGGDRENKRPMQA